MGFVKEKRLVELSRAIYAANNWEDTSEIWSTSSLKYPLAVYDSNYATQWNVERKLNFNTFEYMGRNTDNDVLIDEDDTIWNLLTDYYWSADASANKLKTLDGNWEDKTQLDRTEIDLGSNFKYAWAGIESTWDSLT